MDFSDMAQNIEEKYRNYLKTTFYFRDPEFRNSFEENLVKGCLSKGPFLEAIPSFAQGDTPRNLLKKLGYKNIDDSFLSSLEGDRSLYSHQEKAFRRALSNENYVVATGTGSGKTEAFLYPILFHIYQEFLNGNLKKGIRAIILYPMNALANDQRDRLGKIASILEEKKSAFRFTFGQFIGETPEDANDSTRNARDHLNHRLPGELVLRSEMRTTPPHILLTNYSMLEYLLLRPNDSPLFDNGASRFFKFIVLDEVHQYNGSRATEMAMLLRRLKLRLRDGGCTDQLQCIATSATLSDPNESNLKISHFVTELFGEPFLKENIITAEKNKRAVSEYTLEPEDYQVLQKALSENDQKSIEKIHTLYIEIKGDQPDLVDIPRLAGAILKRDKKACSLLMILEQSTKTIDELAEKLFPEKQSIERKSLINLLVQLLIKARDPESGTALLSARYHFFLRSLEGAFISYYPQKRIFIDRKITDRNGMVFEVALCRECGQHYIIGKIKNGHLVEAVQDPSQTEFGISYFRPLENAGSYVEEDESEKQDTQKKYSLCLICGAIAQEKNGDLKCGHNKSITVVKEDSSNENGNKQISRCGFCGFTGGNRDPVRSIVYGTDGPNVVIATSLFQLLSEGKRKILAFADNRQEAAYFAWYLEDSYQEIARRNAMNKILCGIEQYPSDGLSLISLFDLAYKRSKNYFQDQQSSDESTIKKNIQIAFYRELMTNEKRISLEGVGLLQWKIKLPEGLVVPILMLNPPWSLDDTQARNLIAYLLDTLRSDKAIEINSLPDAPINFDDLSIKGTQLNIKIGEILGNRNMRSWDGKRGGRAKYLSRILIKKGIREEDALEKAVQCLRQIWDNIREYDENASLNDRIFYPINDARRLNPNWYRAFPIHKESHIFVCNICGRVHASSLFGICSSPHCNGDLELIDAVTLERNHYRQLYQSEMIPKMRVEEHTAQLDHDVARFFQHEFGKGKIDVLSCSTTFELGVDLGDLDNVFLRNIPPEAFNYAQRVGRCGRRPGNPGFAISYCRRASHDLFYFLNPERMINGKIKAPSISLQNEKILVRHMTAYALTKFFYRFPDRFRSVNEFIIDFDNPKATSDFNTFIIDNITRMTQDLMKIIPIEMHTQMGLHNENWVKVISGIGEENQNESRLYLAEVEVSSDFKSACLFEEQATKDKRYKLAQWANDRKRTIADEDVLSFLSRKAVIPKYGFPVDVVELDTNRIRTGQESSKVTLQRDLSMAISEFAPSSSIIDNKKEWTSFGIKRVPEKELQKVHYKYCEKHNAFMTWNPGEQEPELPCKDNGKKFDYIIPQFGFTTSIDPPKNPTGRVEKVFSTRPHFVGILGNDIASFLTPKDDPIIEITKSIRGKLVVLCEGKKGAGFYICEQCGAGFRERPSVFHKPHNTSMKQPCTGQLEWVYLGHEFVTDIVQIKIKKLLGVISDRLWFAYSLGYALLAGTAQVLEIPENDINITVGRLTETEEISIIMYDDVPGGAGLVSQIEKPETFKKCLEASLERVNGSCGCGEDTSCYGCLRNYRNQFAHPNLKRGDVRYFLTELLSRI